MILPTGNSDKPDPSCDNPQRCRRQQTGLTLIELILVMAMLVIAVSVTVPSLSGFFRGRVLISEAKRFLALTRYGQSRAVSEGLPMVLWIDSKESAYGLQADSSYTDQDSKKLEFRMNKDVQVEVLPNKTVQPQAQIWRGTGGGPLNVPKIRFRPDGFIEETSPEFIVFRQNPDAEMWIGPSHNRLNYEIQTNQVANLRR